MEVEMESLVQKVELFFEIIDLNNKFDEILETRETIKILQLLKISITTRVIICNEAFKIF